MGQKTRWDGEVSLADRRCSTRSSGGYHSLMMVKNKQFIRYTRSNPAINDTYRNRRKQHKKYHQDLNVVTRPNVPSHHVELKDQLSGRQILLVLKLCSNLGGKSLLFQSPDIRCGLILFRHSTLLFNFCLHWLFQRRLADPGQFVGRTLGVFFYS